MEQKTTKRTRRTISKEEKIQKLQDEISKHEAKILELKQKIENLETPQVTMKDVTAKAKEYGLTPEELMKAVDKLGSKK